MEIKQARKVCSSEPLSMLSKKAKDTLEKTLTNSQAVATGLRIVQHVTRLLEKSFRKLKETELLDFFEYQVGLLGKKRQKALQNDLLQASASSTMRSFTKGGETGKYNFASMLRVIFTFYYLIELFNEL